MSELYSTISGSDGVVVNTYLCTVLPDNQWPSWKGGYHLPDILVKQEQAPNLDPDTDIPHDYCCPETIVISGGGIEDGEKHDPETRLDNE